MAPSLGVSVWPSPGGQDKRGSCRWVRGDLEQRSGGDWRCQGGMLPCLGVCSWEGEGLSHEDSSRANLVASFSGRKGACEGGRPKVLDPCQLPQGRNVPLLQCHCFPPVQS